MWSDCSNILRRKLLVQWFMNNLEKEKKWMLFNFWNKSKRRKIASKWTFPYLTFNNSLLYLFIKTENEVSLSFCYFIHSIWMSLEYMCSLNIPGLFLKTKISLYILETCMTTDKIIKTTSPHARLKHSRTDRGASRHHISHSLRTCHLG